MSASRLARRRFSSTQICTARKPGSSTTAALYLPTTVVDLSADRGARDIELVQRWGDSVWSAWSHVHDEVADMTDRQLDGWHPRTSS